MSEPCKECGADVSDADLHSNWHANLGIDLKHIYRHMDRIHARRWLDSEALARRWLLVGPGAIASRKSSGKPMPPSVQLGKKLLWDEADVVAFEDQLKEENRGVG